MHRLRPAILSILGCLLLGLVGCSVGAPKPLIIRSIYVEEASGGSSPDLGQFSAVIHDTSVRVLEGLGYVVAMEPARAGAFLHAVWMVRPPVAGTPQGRVTLKLTVVARDGTVFHVVEVVTDMPASFLSQERLADLIRTKLGMITR